MPKHQRKPEETKLVLKLKSLHMTQRELARRMGKKFTALNYACKCGIKTVRVAEMYAPYLNCDPQELLEFTTRSPRA